VYLFGQAATMTDMHVFIYGLFASIIVATVLLFYKELQLIVFDRDYAKSLGVKVATFDGFIFVLITLAVVIGIRSVGVVLMSAMLIAPAASARQFTHKLNKMFGLAALFGLLSGFLGVYLSVELSYLFENLFLQSHFAIPTGPMIVIVASSICMLALLFAPERGLFCRWVRIGKFRYQCISENLLKSLWYEGVGVEIDLPKQRALLHIYSYYFSFLLYRFLKKGWVEKSISHKYFLSKKGLERAAQIVRLHRLWEVYLADYLGVGAERVHRSAEEMEHIITPDLEKELTVLLDDPKRDPHHQIIPPKVKSP
jgi:manganese/zinc/iron transport system permease protein